VNSFQNNLHFNTRIKFREQSPDCKPYQKMAPTTLFRLPTRQCLRSTTLRSTFSPVQPLSQTTIPRYPRKGYEDKDSINPEATEYSKSGTDDAAAKQEEAAFDPSTTDPQEEKDVAGKGNEVFATVFLI
jgi:hypothetical protein